MNMYKSWISRLAVCSVALTGASACLDLQVPNYNNPPRDQVLATPEAIESLIQGSYRFWWWVNTYFYPGSSMLVVADAASSSWANFGMRDQSQEPRVAYDNNATYTYSAVNVFAWNDSYTALNAARNGLLAAKSQREKILNTPNFDLARLERMEAFATLVQAVTLSSLAVIFDSAYAVVEDTKLDSVGLAGYDSVWTVALGKYDEFNQMAQGATWSIPSAWVACNGDWTPSRAIEIARVYRARYAAQIARDPQERESADWTAIKADAAPGLTSHYAGLYANNDECGWAWNGIKWPALIHESWGRIDYRTIGPADASGAWETWIDAAANAKRPFPIDTDDRRITGGAPNTDGKYVRYYGSSPFPADRGLYHYSHYKDYRWDYIYENNFLDEWVVFDEKELEFLVAEADYRAGNTTSTMNVVNKYRTINGELPAFNTAGGVAPGGSRCVPQNPDGTCGNLWEAFKYEKRIEVFGYSLGVEFFDDRGWGDLVCGSWEQLPIPGGELDLLGKAYYTFGGDCASGSSGASIADLGHAADLGLGRAAGKGKLFEGDMSPEAIHARAALMDALLKTSRRSPHDFVDAKR